MLLVRAKAGASKIHGMGLIAQEFIPAGTTIWSFMPGFDVQVSKSTLRRLSPTSKEQLLYYAYFHAQSGMLVLSSDDDRFTNHADIPNTHLINDDVIAKRDIHSGEEITADYRELGISQSFGSCRLTFTETPTK